MDMHIVAVPLYDKEMAVHSYVFRYRKGTDMFMASRTTTLFDGASRSAALEVLGQVGLDAFTLGKDIFVPIDTIMLLGGLHTQCGEPADKIIFLFEEPPKLDDFYLSKITELTGMGYRFALSNLRSLQKYVPIIQNFSHVFLSRREEHADNSDAILAEIKKNHRALSPVATHIRSADIMKKLTGKGYSLYESRIFIAPKDDHQVSPLKANSIRLLNVVQDENFEFEQVTSIVQGDTALTISLLKMVNVHMSHADNKIKTISQAVTMLGQREVRKWVTTAVSQSLGSDRPNEITRISLVRAKFAENLAPLFEMAHMAQSLFLTGLFSVLDIILDVPMTEALRVVHVSDMIHNALVDHSGLYYPVLDMIIKYENAFWSEVSRLAIVHGISEESLSDAYINALIWYKDLIRSESSEDAVDDSPPAQ